METKAAVFRALADETRLRILNLFVKSGEVLCVCELIDALKLPQYAVSKALTIMKNAGLFNVNKKGTWVYYELSPTPDHNKKLFKFLKKYLSKGIFPEDELRLKKRLLLREGNKCVVGIIPEKDLLKMIKKKADV